VTVTQPSMFDISSPRVSVAICTHTDDRFDDLCQAIASVERQTKPAVEIVVVVDRNPGLLSQVVEAFPSLRVLSNRHHPGVGGARNSAVEAALGEVVAFLDDDARAEPDWLEKLLSAFSEPDVLGGGGKITPLWATGRPRWFPTEFDWVVGCSYKGLPEETAAVRNVIGASMMIRKPVLQETGGFLPGFGKVGDVSEPEETEFCIRAQQRWPQGRWIYVPDAIIQHRVTHERETWRYFLIRCKNEGKGKARMVGRDHARETLTSERHYVSRVLPRGVVRGIIEGLRGDMSGFARAAAITIGFTVTAVTFELERLRVNALSRRGGE
jgi:GT2 family glycosyltransferase